LLIPASIELDSFDISTTNSKDSTSPNNDASALTLEMTESSRSPNNFDESQEARVESYDELKNADNYPLCNEETVEDISIHMSQLSVQNDTISSSASKRLSTIFKSTLKKNLKTKTKIEK
jgi:hypothetical protein